MKRGHYKENNHRGILSISATPTVPKMRRQHNEEEEEEEEEEEKEVVQKLTFNVTSMSRNRFVYPSPFNFSLNLKTKPTNLEDRGNDDLNLYFNEEEEKILENNGMGTPHYYDELRNKCNNNNIGDNVFVSSTPTNNARSFNPVSDQTPIITWKGNNFIRGGGKTVSGKIYDTYKGISTVDYTMVIVTNEDNPLHAKLNYYKGACVSVRKNKKIRLKIKESRPSFSHAEPHRVWEKTRDTDAWRADVGVWEDDYQTNCLTLTMTTLVDTTWVGTFVDIKDESFVQSDPNTGTGGNPDGGPYSNRIFVPCFRPLLYSLVGAYLYNETTETAFPVESTDVPSSMIILSQKNLSSKLSTNHTFSLRRRPPARTGKLLQSNIIISPNRIYAVELDNPDTKLVLYNRCGNWLRISTPEDEYYQLIGSVTKLLINGTYRIIGEENQLYRTNVNSGLLPNTLPTGSRVEILQFNYDSSCDINIDVADIRRRQLVNKWVANPMRVIENPVVNENWRMKILGVVLPDFNFGRNWTDYQTNKAECRETNGVRSFDYLTLTISGRQINDKSLEVKTTPYPLTSDFDRGTTNGGTKSFNLTRPLVLPNENNVLFTCDEGDSEIYFNPNIGDGMLNFKFTDPLGRDLDSFERGPPHAPDHLGQSSIRFQLFVK